MSIPNIEMEFTKNYTTNNMFRTHFTGIDDTDTTKKKKQKKVNNSLGLFACCHGDQLCSLGDMWGSNSNSRRSHYKQYDVETVDDNDECSSVDYATVDDSIESAIQRHNQRKDHSLTQKFVAQSKPKQTSVVHTSISTAATAVIQNTTLRHAAAAAAAAAMEETKMDEAQRALDWIQDPQSHKGRLTADSSISSNSILAVPPPTESQPQHQQEENKQDNVPQTHTELTSDPSKPQVEDEDEQDPSADVAFSYWKKVDQKVAAQKHKLQQKHQLETQTLQHQKQEQENLLQSRLQTMFPDFVAAMPPHVVIAPDRSEIELEQQELEEEQQREFGQKEAELEVLQSAIHKRLTPSMPNNHTTTATATATTTETNNTKTRLERKLEGGKTPNVGTPPNKVQEEHAVPEVSVQEQEPTTTTYSSPEHVQVRRKKIDETRVPPLPPSLEAAVPPKAESSEEHKQHMLESPDRDNAHSLRPNQRLQPIQCKIEIPKESPRDAEKEKRMAEEKRLRDQFKAARLKALVEQQNSFSTLDDLSTATPSSAKTTETSQTTQTTSSSRASSLPPTITQLPPRRRRGESAKLAAKRKELEWKWNSAKKPIQDLEQKQLAKSAKTKKLPTTKQEQEPDGKWLMDYKPLVEEQLQPRSGTPPKQKVWSKKKLGTMTTTTTTAASAPTIGSIDDNDGKSPKSRLSELVERQREMQARHQNRKTMQGKWENRSNEESTASSAQSPPAAVAQTPPGPSMSSVNQRQQQQQQEEEEKASMVITPERESASELKTRFSGYLELQRSKDLEGKAVVTPERPLKASPPCVTGFWEQKRSNEEGKQKRRDMREKWMAGVRGKSSPAQEEDKPVSKIEAKRRELAEKRKEFEKQKREASNRLEQELLGYPDADTLLEEEAKAPAVDTKHLVGKFEGLGTRSTSKNTAVTTTKAESPLPLDGFGPIQKFPPSRQMADWKQKELDRRNTEYQTSLLQQFDRTKSHEVASSTAWPDLVSEPQTPLPPQSQTDDEARSDHSVPEKDITRKQQLSRAWRHRAWKAIDKVDHVVKDRQSKELGTAAVQLVMENSSKYAVQTEQF
jgi:hypothetical protein